MRSSIHSLADLEEFGICFLTGESCAYNMRALFDLNAEGKQLMEKFLGVQITSEPWNKFVNEQPAVASILMPMELIPALNKFVLLEEGHDLLYIQPRAIFGYNSLEWESLTDDSREYLLENGTLLVNPAKQSNAPHRGGRNEHIISGRIE